jgi:hypothetical protein
MKKVINLLLVAFAVVAFHSCTKSGDSPEAVAEKFLQHLYKNEFTEAKAFGTESTGQYLDMLKSFADMSGDAKKEVEDVKIENLKAETDGDKAMVTYTIDGKEDQLPLIKQDGKWLVNMSKEDQMGDMGEDEMMEEETGEEEVVETEAVPAE